MTLKQLAARLRKDSELMAVVHISDEEALAIADAIAPVPKPVKVKLGATAPKCGAYIPGHHAENCVLLKGHKGECEP